MNQDEILEKIETRRTFSSETWVSLRASCNEEQGEVKDIGYVLLRRAEKKEYSYNLVFLFVQSASRSQKYYRFGLYDISFLQKILYIYKHFRTSDLKEA